jgi:ATP-binding cassette subfamily B protein
MRLRRTAASSPDAEVLALIGVDDLKTPWWAQTAETVASSGAGRMLRKAPAALAVIVRLAWQTSPRLTARPPSLK